MLSIIVSWRDRHELVRALPHLIEAARKVHGDITIVNFSGSKRLLRGQIADSPFELQILDVPNQRFFNKSAAQNIGASFTSKPVLFFCDCDIILDPESVSLLAERVISEDGSFATLAGVRESRVNARKAKHVVCFGYELRVKTADNRLLVIKDNEEDGQTGTRQAPGLLFVRRTDFVAIQGYNSNLRGWGWEDQDMISRLTLGLGLKRIVDGHATHISHDDLARTAAYPPVSSRWESRDAMFRTALANYDNGNFLGTYERDVASLKSAVSAVARSDRLSNADSGPCNDHFRTSGKQALKLRIEQKPSISACLIARDEAKVIARCLDSIASVCDELCVVDTGSVDGTPQIAASYGAKLLHFTECNGPDGKILDFSAARNAALDMASGKWILQIDADEVLETGAENIRRYATGELYDRIGITLISEGAEWISGRMFKRSKCSNYQGRVHEYIACKGSFHTDPHIVIRNIPNKVDKEDAMERNIRLCRLAIRENPEDARNYHYLGNEYRESGLLKRARFCYTKALALGNFKLGIFHSAYYRAICYLLEREWGRAVRAGLDAVEIDPRYAEGHCLIGDAYSCMGNLAFARAWYQNALNCVAPPSDALFPIQLWAYHAHPQKRLLQIGTTMSRARASKSYRAYA
jgi:glycosyltransferase involved in cell wall biosynthesis